jgi:hypothetical protein
LLSAVAGNKTCTCKITARKAVPWLRRLAAGLPQRRPGFDPGSVYVGFVVNKVALGQVFSPESFGFPLLISFHRCSIARKRTKKIIIIFIFITGLHNKPQGCGTSVASTAGPFSTSKKTAWNVYEVKSLKIRSQMMKLKNATLRNAEKMTGSVLDQ